MAEGNTKEADGSSKQLSFQLMSLAMTRAPQGDPRTAGALLAGEFLGIGSVNNNREAKFSDLWDLDIDKSLLQLDAHFLKKQIDETLDVVNWNRDLKSSEEIFSLIDSIPSNRIKNYMKDYFIAREDAKARGFDLRRGTDHGIDLYSILLLPEELVDFNYTFMERAHDKLNIKPAFISKLLLARQMFPVLKDTLKLLSSQIYGSGVVDVDIREASNVTDRMISYNQDIKHGFVGLPELLQKIDTGIPKLNYEIIDDFRDEYEYAKERGKYQVERHRRNK